MFVAIVAVGGLLVVIVTPVATAVLAVLNVQIPVNALEILLTPVLPLLVGVVTKKFAPSWYRAVMLAVLSVAAVAVVNAIAAHGTFEVWSFVTSSFREGIFAFGVYAGFLKHGVAQKVQDATAHIGIGPGEKGPRTRLVRGAGGRRRRVIEGGHDEPARRFRR